MSALVDTAFVENWNTANMCLTKQSSSIIQLPFLLPWASAPLYQVARRHESSSRRTTKRLRTKPDPSFTASISPSQIRDQIVFNPPSSAPSPYQTPLAFLPINDPRRKLLSQSHEHANPHSNADERLPPPLRKTQEKKYHLKPEDIAEIRRLRTLDPFKYTRKSLAEKFGCSTFFVGMVAEASKEKKEHEAKVLENIKSRWGKRRTYAREDRQRRRELWGRDE
ncbi:54S ribosomal protein L20 [Physcia stellaris]|nr:54S ribosomal protein L20 [Physcia stellaris]